MCVCVCVYAVDGEGSGWMVNRIPVGFDFYFNVDSMQQCWLLPESVTLDQSLLTHADIQVCTVDCVTLHC